MESGKKNSPSTIISGLSVSGLWSENYTVQSELLIVLLRKIVSISSEWVCEWIECVVNGRRGRSSGVVVVVIIFGSRSSFSVGGRAAVDGQLGFGWM